MKRNEKFQEIAKIIENAGFVKHADSLEVDNNRHDWDLWYTIPGMPNYAANLFGKFLTLWTDVVIYEPDDEILENEDYVIRFENSVYFDISKLGKRELANRLNAIKELALKKLDEYRELV